ncbi:hypothetical protein IAU60_006584 [Kwoniella sp. DSM 27419]
MAASHVPFSPSDLNIKLQVFEQAVRMYHPDRRFLQGVMSNNGYKDPTGSPITGRSPRRQDDDDVSKYQFWPEAIAMGSLKHRTFTQILGAACIKGVNQASREGHGRSFFAFDFRRELLVIRADLLLPKSQLPLALRPLDAELSFDDITSHGIHITHQTVNGRYTVTVTVTCRRPPKFFAPFENSIELLGKVQGRMKVYRRRATAMDFAITGVAERNAGPVKAIPEGPCAFPTFWNTYRWAFNMDRKEYDRLLACAKRIRVLAESDPELDLMSNLRVDTIWQVIKMDAAAFKHTYDPPDLSNIRFSARTLVEGLIAHGIIRPVDVEPLFAALKENAVIEAFQDRILEDMYSMDRIRDVAVVVRQTAKCLRRKPPPNLDHLVLIRTVLVTPTRVLVGPRQHEPSNSVTRRYADRLDGIIRVQFTDEEDRLHIANYVKQADELRPDIGIPARIRRCLQHGLVIGGQTFLPVAASASQQK